MEKKEIKNATLIFDYFEMVHYYKDPGMILNYLNKLYNIDVCVVSYSKTNNTEKLYLNNLKVLKLKKGFVDSFVLYILKNAKNIDLLILFHNKQKNFFYRFLYKFLNPTGKTYLKLDFNNNNLYEIESFYEAKQKIKNILELKNGIIKYLKIIKKFFLYNKIKKEFSKFDIVSVEIKEIYKKLKDILKINNLYYIPNGFDNLSQDIPEIFSFKKKQDIILTVGRIGSPEKNNKMLLNVLKKLDLKNWKVYFIGPIENTFIKIIDNFYKEKPAAKEKVFFLGNIEDRKELYSWYNKSKIFCLTSKWEGFSLALIEAIYFGNYIIGTNVGAIEEITENSKIGKIIEINDEKELFLELQNIIDGKKDIRLYYEKIVTKKSKYLWENIIKYLKKIIDEDIQK